MKATNPFKALIVVLLIFTAPPSHAQTDIDKIFDAIVGVHATIPADARTADALGTERAGSGVVIDDNGLVLTIGYLILEAATVEIETAYGRRLPADIVAYDYDTGFGLVRTLTPAEVPPLRLGTSAGLGDSTPVLAAGFGGPGNALGAMIVDRRTFAGYWEYLLEDAIFTTPPHFNHSGAALIDTEGQLVGIGSLILPDVFGFGSSLPGNMFVPIDALKPILADLLTDGRSAAPRKPWLGIFTDDTGGQVQVISVSAGGPGEAAGIAEGDVILAVGDRIVTNMEDFFRAVWSLGEPGVEVPLVAQRGDAPVQFTVTSRDRYDWLRLDPTY